MPYQMEKEDRADGIGFAHSRTTTDHREWLHEAERGAQACRPASSLSLGKKTGEEGWVELCLGQRLGRSPCTSKS